MSDATVRLGMMCPSNTYGNLPGISRLHTCVDFTIVPSGKLILSGFVAGRTFFIGVFFMTIIDVVPVSTTVCVMGIVGFLGCLLGAHMCCCCFDRLSVTTAISLLSMLMFCVGHKVWFETNEFKHFTSTCSAPHRHLSHIGQLTFVHRLGARIIPRCNVLSRIISIKTLLVISTSPRDRACL